MPHNKPQRHPKIRLRSKTNQAQRLTFGHNNFQQKRLQIPYVAFIVIIMVLTETDNSCLINGNSVECPSQSSITWDGIETIIDVMLQCPLDTVDQFDHIRASQLGLCTCDTAIVGDDPSDPLLPVPCDCYACPEGSRIGHAIWCSQQLIGVCNNFTCDGTCNGLIGIDQITYDPTGAPTSMRATSDGGSTQALTSVLIAFGTLLVAKLAM